MMDAFWWKGLPLAEAGSGEVPVLRDGVRYLRPNGAAQGWIRAFKRWAEQDPELYRLGLYRAQDWAEAHELVTLEWRRGWAGSDRVLRGGLAPIGAGHPFYPTARLIALELGLRPEDCQHLAEPLPPAQLPSVLHLHAYPARRREQFRLLAWLQLRTRRLLSS